MNPAPTRGSHGSRRHHGINMTRFARSWKESKPERRLADNRHGHMSAYQKHSCGGHLDGREDVTERETHPSSSHVELTLLALLHTATETPVALEALVALGDHHYSYQYLSRRRPRASSVGPLRWNRTRTSRWLCRGREGGDDGSQDDALPTLLYLPLVQTAVEMKFDRECLPLGQVQHEGSRALGSRTTPRTAGSP
jgi:hypothetical protein